jgi:FtsZ-binding cell division protein ZapB
VSDSERPDLIALDELQRLLHALEEEMIALRRRAHAAEARLKELEESSSQLAVGSSGVAPSSVRHEDAVVRENEILRARLQTARERTRAILGRVRFLRQQHETAGER